MARFQAHQADILTSMARSDLDLSRFDPAVVGSDLGFSIGTKAMDVTESAA
jgi:hypothetical protein